MSVKAPPKVQRIDFRVSTGIKTLFSRAAKLTGSSLSSFVIAAARERARLVLAEHDRIVLDNQAHDAFLKILGSPPAPNAALRRATSKVCSGRKYTLFAT